MTVIELGEITSGSPAPELPRPRAFYHRRYAVAAVAAVCLLAVAGAERPESRTLTTLWSTADQPNENFLLTGDTLYLFGTTPGTVTRAYDAADGRLRWSRPVEGQNAWIYGERAGVVLMPGAEEQRTGVDAAGDTFSEQVVKETVGLDAVTGTELWRRRGEPSATTGEAVLLTEWDFRGRGVRGMQVVRTRDGGMVWSWTPRQQVAHWAISGRLEAPTGIIAATADGRIEVRRFTDGGVTARGQVPWVASRESDGAFTDLFAWDDTMFVARSVGTRVTVNAYAVDSLRPRWMTSGTVYTGMMPCGPVLCLGGGPAGLVGHDPRTGAVRWRTGQWDNAQPLPGGRLLLQAGDSGRSGLADAESGRLIADLGTRPTVTNTADGTVVTLTPTRQPAGGTAVHEVRPTGRMVLRGALTGVVHHGCQAAGRRLACLNAGDMRVTAVG
jgi:outer membrane protein assembly factor BamB